MALPTLSFNPSWTLNVDTRPEVTSTQLGDGFTYETPTGLRSRTRRLRLRFINRSLAEIQPIIDFLEERNGVGKFNYTPPPPHEYPGIWIAPFWGTRRLNQGEIWTLNVEILEK